MTELSFLHWIIAYLFPALVGETIFLIDGEGKVLLESSGSHNL